MFDKWYEENGYDLQHKEFARLVWNGAIAAARNLVEERYDEMEPWLEPSDVTDALGA